MRASQIANVPGKFRGKSEIRSKQFFFHPNFGLPYCSKNHKRVETFFRLNVYKSLKSVSCQRGNSCRTTIMVVIKGFDASTRGAVGPASAGPSPTISFTLVSDGYDWEDWSIAEAMSIGDGNVNVAEKQHCMDLELASAGGPLNTHYRAHHNSLRRLGCCDVHGIEC